MKVFEVTLLKAGKTDEWLEPVFMAGETMEDVFKAISNNDIDWSRVVNVNVLGEMVS